MLIVLRKEKGEIKFFNINESISPQQIKYH